MTGTWPSTVRDRLTERYIATVPPVPVESGHAWRRCIDTALESPDDICPMETAPVVRQASYLVQPRSVVLLALTL